MWLSAHIISAAAAAATRWRDGAKRNEHEDVLTSAINYQVELHYVQYTEERREEKRRKEKWGSLAVDNWKNSSARESGGSRLCRFARGLLSSLGYVRSAPRVLSSRFEGDWVLFAARLCSAPRRDETRRGSISRRRSSSARLQSLLRSPAWIALERIQLEIHISYSSPDEYSLCTLDVQWMLNLLANEAGLHSYESSYKYLYITLQYIQNVL